MFSAMAVVQRFCTTAMVNRWRMTMAVAQMLFGSFLDTICFPFFCPGKSFRCPGKWTTLNFAPSINAQPQRHHKTPSMTGARPALGPAPARPCSRPAAPRSRCNRLRVRTGGTRSNQARVELTFFKDVMFQSNNNGSRFSFLKDASRHHDL